MPFAQSLLSVSLSRYRLVKFMYYQASALLTNYLLTYQFDDVAVHTVTSHVNMTETSYS